MRRAGSDGVAETVRGDDFRIQRVAELSRSPWQIRGRKYTTVAYRPEFSFLMGGLDDDRIMRIDHGSALDSTLYEFGHARFVARDMGTGDLDEVLASEVNSLAGRAFQHCLFEPVAAYFLEEQPSGVPLMVHRYSGGLDFYALRGVPDTGLRETISLRAAQALGELHGLGITYSLAVPTHFRYRFDDSVALDPHQHVHVGSDCPREMLQDLMVFVKTNPWVPDVGHFLETYLDTKQRRREVQLITAACLMEEINEEWDWALSHEDTLPEIRSVWRPWKQ